MIKIPAVYVQELEKKKLSSDYTVTINGKECEVRPCRVSSMPFNRVWPGYQRSLDQTESASFITFSADESVVINVRCRRDFAQAVIRPLAKNIKVNRNKNMLNFTLRKPGQYVLETDNEHFALHIFFNEIKEYPEKEKATYYFGPGVHCPGLVKLHDHDSVYVDDEAIVYGALNCEGAEDIHIFGGGIIDDSCEERIFEHCYKNYTKGCIKMYHTKNILIEDVILMNSPIWVISFFYCDNVKIDSVKIIGHWKYNTDGIDICNTSNVMIENSFIRAFDDVVTIKGIYETDDSSYEKDKVIENITVDNCVMWCGWGRSCEIGIETAVKEYRNITFRNCDLIHSSAAALDIQNGFCAEIHDITFADINVEYQRTALPEIYQSNDETEYEPNSIGEAYLIFSSNHQCISTETGAGGEMKEEYIYPQTHDIFYKNINVYLDEGMPYPKIYIVSQSEKCIHRNFTIDGLYVNGKKCEDLNAFEFTSANVENIILK